MEEIKKIENEMKRENSRLHAMLIAEREERSKLEKRIRELEKKVEEKEAERKKEKDEVETLRSLISEVNLELDVWKDDIEERKQEVRKSEGGIKKVTRKEEATEEKREKREKNWADMTISDIEEEESNRDTRKSIAQAQNSRERSSDKKRKLDDSRYEAVANWRQRKEYGLVLIKGNSWPTGKSLGSWLNENVGENQWIIERCVTNKRTVKVYFSNGAIWEEVWARKKEMYVKDLMIMDVIRTKGERVIRAKIIEEVKRLKKETETHSLRTRLKDDRVEIDGIWYTWDIKKDRLVREEKVKDLREVIEERTRREK